MALPQDKIEESKEKIPCGDYAVIKLLKRIQSRLRVDDIDLPCELNEYADSKHLKWAIRITEADIRAFKKGKRLTAVKDFQIANWLIREMTEMDRQVVFYHKEEPKKSREEIVHHGNGRSNKRKRIDRNFGHKKGRCLQVKKRRLAICEAYQ